MLTGKHLIAGQWVAGEATFQSSPATGAALTFAVLSTRRVEPGEVDADAEAQAIP